MKLYINICKKPSI